MSSMKPGQIYQDDRSGRMYLISATPEPSGVCLETGEHIRGEGLQGLVLAYNKVLEMLSDYCGKYLEEVLCDAQFIDDVRVLISKEKKTLGRTLTAAECFKIGLKILIVRAGEAKEECGL